MSYLVRKINKKAKVMELNTESDINNASADLVTGEFRTTNNKLSTWYIEDLNSIDDAVLAIAISGTDVSKIDVIIINTDILKEKDVKYSQTYAGMDIGVPDLQDTHYDLEEITLKKIISCCHIYKELANEKNADTYIIRYTKKDVLKLFDDAIAKKRVEIENTRENVKTEIAKKMNIDIS